MEWLKLTSKGILRGSLAQSTDVVQLVWIKLLCLMNETKFRNGRFEYVTGKPYTLDYLAMNCGVTLPILEGCLCEFEEDINPDTNEPRIKYDDDGTLILVNWWQYQSKPEKIVAQEIAKAKAKETKRRQGLVADALLQAMNTMNARLKASRYQINEKGDVIDTNSGEVMTVEEFKKKKEGE